MDHLQVHGLQVQLSPHLQPPFSAPVAAAAPSNDSLEEGATPMTMVWLVVTPSSISGYILHLHGIDIHTTFSQRVKFLSFSETLAASGFQAHPKGGSVYISTNRIKSTIHM
jgi:hypothetical protein